MKKTLKNRPSHSQAGIAVLLFFISNTAVAFDFNLDGVDPVGFNFSQSQITHFRNNDSIGQIFGGRTRLKRCAPFIGCVDLGTLDTRTGVTFQAKTDISIGYDFNVGLAMRDYEAGSTTISYSSSFDKGDIRGDGFRSLIGTSTLSTNSFTPWSLGGPDVTANFGVQAGFDAEFKTRAFLAGNKLIDNVTRIAGIANLDLLNIDTRLANPLQIAPGLVSALPGFGVEADAGFGDDVLLRKTFGGGVLVASLLDPTETFTQSVRNDNGTVVRSTSLDILRAGIDVLKLSPATKEALTGNRVLSGGYSLDYNLAALELGVALGYSAETRFSGDIQGATLSFDKTVALRESNGSLTVVAAGELFAFTDIDSLPDVQVIGGGTVVATLSLHDVALIRDVDHSIVITPGGILTVLPEADLLKNGNKVKLGPLPIGLPSIAQLSLKLNPGIEIPIGSTGGNVIIDNILGISSQTHTRSFDGLTREYFIYEGRTEDGFHAGIRDMPTTTVIDPITGAARIVDHMALNSSEQQIDHLFSSVSDRAKTSNDVVVIPTESFDTTFFNTDPAIQRNIQLIDRDLQLDGYDLGGLFQGIRIEDGRMLHVINLDRTDNFDSAGNIISLSSLENDGLLYMQARNPNGTVNTSERTAWLNTTALRSFTGTGQAVFDVQTHVYASNGGAFFQGEGHTTIITGNDTGNDNFMFFTVPGNENNNTAKLQNNGTLIAKNSGRFVFDYNGKVDKGLINEVGKGLINKGAIISEEGGLSEFRRLRGVTNEGLIAARNGGKVVFDASFNADKFIQLYNSGNSGEYVAEGVASDGTASEIEFKHRLFVRTGEHNITAKNGGKVHFRNGIGKRVFSEIDDEGLLNLRIGDGGLITSDKKAVFSGSVFVEQGGVGRFQQLASRTDEGLDINNFGTLEFLDGWNGTLVEPSVQSGGPLGPGDIAAPAPLQPINFSNQGKIIIHDTASFNFAAEVKESSSAGVVLDVGTWVVHGESGSTGPNNGAVNIELDSPTVQYDFARTDGGLNDRDFVTHNRSDIYLSNSASWDIRYHFSAINHPADRLDNFISKSLMETLQVNEGRLALSNQIWNSQAEFINDGRRINEGLLGELRLDNNSQFNVEKFTNRFGTTNIRSDSTLTANSGEYEISGGSVNVDSAHFAGINVVDTFFYDELQDDRIYSSHYNTVAGTKITVSEQELLRDDGSTETIAARLNVKGIAALQNIKGIADAALLENHADLTLNGAAASISGIEYVGYNAAGASLTLDHGASVTLKYDSQRANASGFLNEGALFIGGGSTLDVKGDYETAGAQFSDGGRFTQRFDGMVTIAENGQLIARSIGLQGTQKVIDNNGLLIVDEFELLSGERLTGSGYVVGDFTANAGAIVGPGNSPGRLTHIGTATYEEDSILELEVTGYGENEFDSLLVKGVLDIQSADLLLNFDSLFEVIANEALELFRVQQSIDINDEFIAGTGLLSGDFGDIFTTGLSGFDTSLAARYGSYANGGEFIGASDNLDLYLFFGAGVDENLVTLAFLDGQKSFQYGSPVPIPSGLPLFLSGILFLIFRSHRQHARKGLS